MGGAAPVEGGKGKKKSLDAVINLVPFIDLLSSLIAFLLMTAVWTQLATLQVGQQGNNAAPSQVLMGDAGSRPLGLLIGMLVVATNNPVFLLLVGVVILLNGATGLAKVALLRFFGLRIFGKTRFPLHDHARKELGWSNTQVLVRFMLLHIGLSALLVIIALKVR